MQERMRFVLRLQDGERMTELCQEFGISRKTGYKLWERYQQDGTNAFVDQPRRPTNSPTRTAKEIEERILAARRKNPCWGPVTLKAWLERKEPGVTWPAKTTLARILSKHGLAKGKKKRRHSKAEGTPLQHAREPNDIWCADFKGQFRLGNGRYCYPLTITDARSRFILACEALESTHTEGVVPVFSNTFKRFGLPSAIRTDNGVPFSTRTLCSFSRLSVWWLRLGIRHERIEPGHPEQNGRHERMHLTLKQEATRPAGATLLQQQEKFDEFVERFNTERPHQALDLHTPDEIYKSSEQEMPAKLHPLAYPLHDITRKVYDDGKLFLRRGHIYPLSPALAGQNVGLRELDDGRWLVSFIDLDLGMIDEKSKVFDPFAMPRGSVQKEP